MAKLDFTIIRGETFAKTITIKKNGTPYTLTDGDVLIYTLKKDLTSKVPDVQKIINTFDDGKARLVLNAEETELLMETVYKQELTLKSQDRVKVLIEKSNFWVKDRV